MRIAAGEMLPALLESAQVRGDAYVQEMGRFLLPPLLQAVASEPEVEVLCEHMAAFAQVRLLFLLKQIKKYEILVLFISPPYGLYKKCTLY